MARLVLPRRALDPKHTVLPLWPSYSASERAADAVAREHPPTPLVFDTSVLTAPPGACHRSLVHLGQPGSSADKAWAAKGHAMLGGSPSASGGHSGSSSPIESSPHEPLSATTTSSASATAAALQTLAAGLPSCSGHPNVFVRCGDGKRKGARDVLVKDHPWAAPRGRRRTESVRTAGYNLSPALGCLGHLPHRSPVTSTACSLPLPAGACRCSGARTRSQRCLASLAC